MLLLLLVSMWFSEWTLANQFPPFPKPSSENTPDYWYKNAIADLNRAKSIAKEREAMKSKRPENFILFIGDGMGVPSITAGRILDGQLREKSGEENRLEFEQWPSTSLMKTYNTNYQTADSAGTATAYLTGSKTIYGVIGVKDTVELGNCSSYDKTEDNSYSFLYHAQKAGKSVGIVTNTRITHATPACGYAHSAHRDWETDAKRNEFVLNVDERTNCPDIASQLITEAINFQVMFGGGRFNFLPKNKITKSASNKSYSGRRDDKIDLISKWKQKQKELGRRYSYIETREQLGSLNTESTDYVLGLFAPDHMEYDIDNKQQKLNEPTLEQMVHKAVQILSKNSKGFALLVEGGRIDHAHHVNNGLKALHEVVALNLAVKNVTALKNVMSKTLTVVTADHSHVFTLGSYGIRGNNIAGKSLQADSQLKNSKGEALAEDKSPMTVLAYANGPSAKINASRDNLNEVDTTVLEYKQQSLVPVKYESHGGEDVALYARGPGSHLFHTTHEQSYIAHVAMHTLCIGRYARDNQCLENASSRMTFSICMYSSIITIFSLMYFVIV